MTSKFIACSLLFVLSISAVFTQQAATQEQTQTAPQPTSALVNLTDENFNNHVTNTSSWLIMYYAPWCPHCKHALPNFEQFAQQVKSELNVGLVDW